MRATAGSPRRVRLRAISSVSMTGTPCPAKRRATVLLPLAIPPVRATLGTDREAGADISEHHAVEIGVDDGVAPHHRDPARRREERSEGDRLAALVPAQDDEPDADDGTDEGR